MCSTRRKPDIPSLFHRNRLLNLLERDGERERERRSTIDPLSRESECFVLGPTTTRIDREEGGARWTLRLWPLFSWCTVVHTQGHCAKSRMYTVIENQYLHSLRSHGWEYYTPREYFIPQRSKSFERAPTDPSLSLSLLSSLDLIAFFRNPRVGSLKLGHRYPSKPYDLQPICNNFPTIVDVRLLGFTSSRKGYYSLLAEGNEERKVSVEKVIGLGSSFPPRLRSCETSPGRKEISSKHISSISNERRGE